MGELYFGHGMRAELTVSGKAQWPEWLSDEATNEAARLILSRSGGREQEVLAHQIFWNGWPEPPDQAKTFLF